MPSRDERVNAVEMSSPSPEVSSIATELRPPSHSAFTPDRHPPTHRSSPQPSRPPSPGPVPPAPSTSLSPRPSRTCSRAVRCLTLRTFPLHNASSCHLCPGPDQLIAPPGLRSTSNSAPMKIVRFASFDTNPSHTFSIGAAISKTKLSGALAISILQPFADCAASSPST